ncbi:MAG: twin-arginine translocase subunit TatC [Gemmataceae bacterium]
MSRGRQADSEDLFAETRMSFGEHIEELRWHLVRAIAGFAIIIHLVFIADGVGYLMGTKFGVGRPMMEFINTPVEAALYDFGNRRLDRAKEELKVKYENEKKDDLKDTEIQFDLVELRRKLGLASADGNDEAQPDFQTFKVRITALQFAGQIAEAMQELQRRYSLKTLSVTEAMFVYLKVAFVCGIVLSSPWVFWQIWSFIAAGLFPHEKKYINVYLPFSLGLFLAGVLTCEFLVIPNAVKALLWFNEWLDLEPDLRLNEWLTFAIMLPLIFGISFQTPLVMLFLERVGIVSINTYRSKRIYAYFGLGFFGALVNPSADLISQFFLLIPLFLLYELGIWLCKLTAKRESDMEVPESEEMVEV